MFKGVGFSRSNTDDRMFEQRKGVIVNLLAPKMGYIYFRSIFIPWEFRCEYT